MIGAFKQTFLGASAVSAPLDFSGGTRTTSGGFNFQTYTSSGTVTCVGGGVVDLILVGGGGGRYQDFTFPARNWSGGGGGGGVIFATGVTVPAGTSSLTVGAGSVAHTNGGSSSIAFAGWNLFTGGGGFGGQGNTLIQAGANGSSSIPSAPYVTVAGAGGGGGVVYGSGGGAGGSGSATTTSGTGSGGGTFSTLTSGNGTTSTGSSFAGGGAGGATANSTVFDGGAGYTWVDSVLYGQGANGGGTSGQTGSFGRGAGSSDITLDGLNGIFIVRWPIV